MPAMMWALVFVCFLNFLLRLTQCHPVHFYGRGFRLILTLQCLLIFRVVSKEVVK